MRYRRGIIQQIRIQVGRVRLPSRVFADVEPQIRRDKEPIRRETCIHLDGGHNGSDSHQYREKDGQFRPG